MYLINTKTLDLEVFTSELDTTYAILSHRWTDGEVTFEDIEDLSVCQKAGVAKITSFCHHARSLGFDWCWVDTCCIDKKSSAELSEAINSMFRWYKHAGLCFVYLSDVQTTSEEDQQAFEHEFRSSAWFTRCWTLQELIAPLCEVNFYNASWQFLGNRSTLVDLISVITGIDCAVLCGEQLSSYCVAERMSWASRRNATRVEDVAYSLMGIFDLQMPLLYGEGIKAFQRLQEAILRYSDDETIFAWVTQSSPNAPDDTGLLASSPAAFASCQYLKPGKNFGKTVGGISITNRGLTLMTTIRPFADEIYLACLGVVVAIDSELDQFVGIYLKTTGNQGEFLRTRYKGRHRWHGTYQQCFNNDTVRKRICVRHSRVTESTYAFARSYGFDILPLSVPSKLIPAPGVIQIAQGTRKLSLRPNQYGPICNIELEKPVHGISLIHLGINDKFQPVCILVSDSINAELGLSGCVTQIRRAAAIRMFDVDYTDVQSLCRVQDAPLAAIDPWEKGPLWSVRGDLDCTFLPLLSMPEQSWYSRPKSYFWNLQLEYVDRFPFKLWIFQFDDKKSRYYPHLHDRYRFATLQCFRIPAPLPPEEIRRKAERIVIPQHMDKLEGVALPADSPGVVDIADLEVSEMRS